MRNLTPKEGFLYVGVRPCSHFQAAEFGQSRSMTKAITEELRLYETKTLEFEFSSARRITPDHSNRKLHSFCSFKATLENIQELPTNVEALRSATHLPLKQADSIVRFEFSASRGEHLDKLFERRDPDISAGPANDRYITHWGTQNWGGLFLEISDERTKIFQSSIDVFAPDDDDLLDGKILMLAYSQDPYYVPEEAGANNRKETKDDLREPETDAEKTSKNGNLVSLGKCIKCGARIEIEEIMLLFLNRDASSYILQGCSSCSARYNVEVLSAVEEERRGHKYEITLVGDE